MVHFHMATMPPRMEALKDSIPSIINQCDHLFVYLNNFGGYVPKILQNPKITVFKSEDEIGDCGDVGKFYGCDNWKPGYHFTVDDKLVYPVGYTDYMISLIEKYKRKAVVSLHGRNFHKRPSESYYFDVKEFFGCLAQCEEQFVEEIGTGVMAFHTDTVLPKWDWFPYMNMTDIYMSMELQKLKIPTLIAAHPRNYIRISNRIDTSYSISQSLNKKDQFQTQVINSFDWNILRC
jgi:hypothetical protein